MKLLLLVQSQADVDALPNAAQAILRSAITGVWVVFSPAITIDSAAAASKFDTEIAQLLTAERQAAERADYEAAKGYKAQRDGKELDRAKALRDAWKTASAEDRKARTQAIFQPFVKTLQDSGNGISARVTSHSDHYDREQWVAMLNSLSGVWFKPFAPGSFVIGWPESVGSSIAAGLKPVGVGAVAQVIPAAGEVVIKPIGLAPLPPRSREQELSEINTNKLRAMAVRLNIDTEGKDKPTLAREVAAAEAGVSAPEPATVEAY